MSDVSLLENNTRNKVRSLWLEGLNIKTICETLGVGVGTWEEYYWNNKQGFRDFIQEVKKEEFLRNAESISRKVFNRDDDTAKTLAIQQKEAEFLRETLGKDLGYSKRIETIGLNINKNEPLDPDQRARLDNLLKNVSGKVNVSVEYVDKQGENETVS
jgi:hypothetical protein